MRKIVAKTHETFIKEYERLSEEDKDEYVALKKVLGSSEFKRKRYFSDQTFKKSLEKIRNFIDKDENDVLLRGIVCGIVTENQIIAICTHNLQCLCSKSSAMINAYFQRNGYVSSHITKGTYGSLYDKITSYNGPIEIKRWNIRRPDYVKEIKLEVTEDDVIDKLLTDTLTDEMDGGDWKSSYPFEALLCDPVTK